MARFWSFLTSGARRHPRKTKPWDGNQNRLLEPVKVVPFKGTGSLLISARMLGNPYPTGRVRFDGTREVRQEAYKVLIQFTGIEILDGNSEMDSSWEKDYKRIDYQGTPYYVRKINMQKNPMLVRCTCKDFFHTWRWEDFKYGVLYGALGRKYIRKTPPPPQGYPYRNPTHVPGYCRHVYQLVMLLKADDWLY